MRRGRSTPSSYLRLEQEVWGSTSPRPIPVSGLSELPRPALTAVILHDPDFNPHMDVQVSLARRLPETALTHQAIARSHRYGQTKPVAVYKLMLRHTVEGQPSPS